MGILRITMRKTSSQSVSGAFTALSVPLETAPKSERVIEPESEAIARS